MTTFTQLQALTRAIDRNMPIACALVFARVAEGGSGGVRQADVQRETGMGSSSMTRNVQALSALNWDKKRPGLDLIAAEVDRNDARHRVLRLTAKGLAASAALKGGDSRHTVGKHS